MKNYNEYVDLGNSSQAEIMINQIHYDIKRVFELIVALIIN